VAVHDAISTHNRKLVSPKLSCAASVRTIDTCVGAKKRRRTNDARLGAYCVLQLLVLMQVDASAQVTGWPFIWQPQVEPNCEHQAC